VIKNIAVVAHFDAEDVLESNFVELLSCLDQVVDLTFLVTTSDIDTSKIPDFRNVVTIKRPNIGYDFYSYRVGIQHALRYCDLQNIILLNSSIVLLKPEQFTGALRRMITLREKFDVVGSTSSSQIAWHLQSYFLLIGCKVLFSDWFMSFVKGIVPQNTKMEIILKYEIGLSQAFVEHEIETTTIFVPSEKQLASARSEWTKKQVHLLGATEEEAAKSAEQVNLTHFLAEPIAYQLGYIKSELLRDNPHQVSLDFVKDLVTGDKDKELQEMVLRARGHYCQGQDNLATLTVDHAVFSKMHRATLGHARRIGVNIAVVLHIYYVELIDEICEFLRNIILPFDVYVTTPSEGDVTRILNCLSGVGQSVTVYMTKNAGRDVGPFISLFRSGILDDYASVLKLHSKKSTYSNRGAVWRTSLFQELAGSSLVVQRALNLLTSSSAGIVGPHNSYLTHDDYWGANRERVRHLLMSMDMEKSEQIFELGFFAGSMFWFKPSALQPLKIIPEAELIFEPEAGLQDGTLAHSLERVFCPMARGRGFKTTSVTLAGQEIHDRDTSQNRVPVL